MKQIVLLGTAYDFDTDLASVAATSRLPVVNVFSTDDTALKDLYPKARRKCPLGFCGAANPPTANFVEYRMTFSDPRDSHVVQVIEGIFVHWANIYFEELQRIVNGERKPYRPHYDCSRAETYLKDHKTPLTLPEHWGVQLAEGVELYQLLRPIFPRDWNVPKLGTPKVLDSHTAGWKLVGLPVDIHIKTKWGVFKKRQYIYFITDPLGRIRSCNVSCQPEEERFATIKSLIVENR